MNMNNNIYDTAQATSHDVQQLRTVAGLQTEHKPSLILFKPRPTLDVQSRANVLAGNGDPSVVNDLINANDYTVAPDAAVKSLVDKGFILPSERPTLYSTSQYSDNWQFVAVIPGTKVIYGKTHKIKTIVTGILSDEPGHSLDSTRPIFNERARLITLTSRELEVRAELSSNHNHLSNVERITNDVTRATSLNDLSSSNDKIMCNDVGSIAAGIANNTYADNGFSMGSNVLPIDDSHMSYNDDSIMSVDTGSTAVSNISQTIDTTKANPTNQIKQMVTAVHTADTSSFNYEPSITIDSIVSNMSGSLANTVYYTDTNLNLDSVNVYDFVANYNPSITVLELSSSSKLMDMVMSYDSDINTRERMYSSFLADILQTYMKRYGLVDLSFTYTSYVPPSTIAVNNNPRFNISAYASCIARTADVVGRDVTRMLNELEANELTMIKNILGGHYTLLVTILGAGHTVVNLVMNDDPRTGSHYVIDTNFRGYNSGVLADKDMFMSNARNLKDIVDNTVLSMR